MTQKTTIEVETRYHFENDEEAYEMIPFLRNSLTSTNQWETHHFGMELFKIDQILRIGKNVRNSISSQFYLGWKGPDHGEFANILEEIDEEITLGIHESAILTLLGGKSTLTTTEEVFQELIRLGHQEFMSFSGQNKLGYAQNEDLHLKLMHCPVLEWPIIVEIEKTAYHFDEALKLEEELLTLTEKLNLHNRLVQKEPPTLLFEACKK